MTRTKIDSLKHAKAKRVNIPTEQMRDFVRDDERFPSKILYPRDTSLDPQLVWTGKDKQDASELEIPVVPIYIQEKISPQAIIEDLRSHSTESTEQPALFSDFNGISFEDMVDFYHHEQNWQNRMILGDSLLVMASLAEKEGMKGQVQTIYIDPPYGIKFGSNWQVSTRKRDVKDGRAEDATRQPEQVKAFRDTWALGIHSYLAYLRDRLVAARELLTESGSCFVQIGDENVHLVRCLMDEVFGSENFCSLITLWKTSGATSSTLPTVSDYILWYAKDIERIKYRQLYTSKESGESGSAEYKYVELINGQRRPATPDELNGSERLPEGARLYRPSPMTSQSASSTTSVTFTFDGKPYTPSSGGWKTNAVGFSRLAASNRIIPRSNSLSYVRYLDDFPVAPINNLWLDTRWGFDASERLYVVQTNVRVVQRCVLMTTDPGDLVLDPTCGSGTTAYVAEQWGRRWITIDTSRVALTLTRTRLMAARFPFYLLADSPDGVKKEAELTNKVPTQQNTEYDIRKGFIYKQVPHITLKFIANNSEATEIHTKWQEKLVPLLRKLNKLIKKEWQEWEVPYEANKSWSKEAQEIHEAWWVALLNRQQEIDASIVSRADKEILFDQPYEDSKRVRVSGPFTVESLSPHRVLSIDETLPQHSEDLRSNAINRSGNFEAMIIDNLKKAGVQNTVKAERLKFERLEPFAGTYLNAEGEYTEAGITKRVAICIGPEHGTVGSELIKDAAKEAVRGLGFDLLVVCGFAFEATTAEESKQYGRLRVLLARMNPDLAMGNELLKKTGSGNLFTVFGEPDITLEKMKDGTYRVEIHGVDVYDPTTGQIRSSSTNDIACWFLDTDYNEESFFVRHAYFSGQGDPYEKLKKTLGADINVDAWSSLYSTKSRPFIAPRKGKIAIKVINHYGDEVLKVYYVH